MKTGLTTDEAFKEMINTRGIYKRLGIHEGTVRRMRSDMRAGIKNITLDKKVELLTKAGFPMVQEMRWDSNKP